MIPFILSCQFYQGRSIITARFSSNKFIFFFFNLLLFWFRVLFLSNCNIYPSLTFEDNFEISVALCHPLNVHNFVHKILYRTIHVILRVVCVTSLWDRLSIPIYCRNNASRFSLSTNERPYHNVFHRKSLILYSVVCYQKHRRLVDSLSVPPCR